MKLVIQFSVLLIWSSLFGYEVKIRVVDDQGVPVPDARAVILFVMFQSGSDIEHVGMTDKNGVFKASGRGKHSVSVSARKANYYEAWMRRLPNDKDLDLVVALPRILNPTPLYAWDSRLGSGIRSAHFPVQNEWLGYDFQVGDWVSPFGRGTVSDIRFRFRQEFNGWKHNEKDLEHSRKVNSQLTEKEFKNFYGKWDAELEISFPGEKEGLFEEMRFLAYSQLKLPHHAPENGYVPMWRYTASSYSPPTARENVGFFLRTRVKLDKAGNIVSANYAKVMGDFRLDARGWVMFAYYFNPVPNDRNLEFDPTRNLFPASFPGAKVSDP